MLPSQAPPAQWLAPLCSCLQQLRHALSGIPTRGMREVRVLDGISSVLKPGRLTLLLGPPGSGKTSLMKALSGQLKRDKGRKVGLEHLWLEGCMAGCWRRARCGP